MGRLRRSVFPGLPHLVRVRSASKQPLFRDWRDFDAYTRFLGQACAKHRVRVLAWCLMEDEISLVVQPWGGFLLSAAIRDAHQRYTRDANRRWKSRGPVFEARYRCCALDARHAKAAIRMIELEPVRAGRVTKVWRWGWSSGPFRCGRAESDRLVAELRAGGLLPDWRRLFMAEDWAAESAVKEAIGSGRPAGAPEFVAHLEKKARRKLAPPGRGRPRKANGRGK